MTKLTALLSKTTNKNTFITDHTHYTDFQDFEKNSFITYYTDYVEFKDYCKIVIIDYADYIFYKTT